MRRPKPKRATRALAGCARAEVKVTSLTIHMGTAPLIPVSFGHGQKGIEITSSNTTIDGYEITGPGCDVYAESGGSYGIYADGVDNLTIRNCTIRQGDYFGIYIRDCTNVTIEDCIVEDITYMGICFLGVATGTIQRNVVRRIGNPPGALQPVNFNAYGIALTKGTGLCSDVLISYNTVSYIPAWHGIDFHGGLRCTIDHNTVHHVARALWMGDNNAGEDSQDCYVTNNLVTDPLNQLPNGTDSNTAISTFNSHDSFVTGNVIGDIVPKYGTITYDSNSTNLTVSGNVRGESLPA